MEQKNGHVFIGQHFLNPDFLLYLFFSPEGRISRKQFWLGLMVSAFLGLILYLLTVELRFHEIYYVDLFMLFVFLFWFVMISIKRFHDLGRSGHYAWLLLIPVVNLWALFMLMCVRGTIDFNEYGFEPRPSEPIESKL